MADDGTMKDAELVPLTQQTPARPARVGRVLLWISATVLALAGGVLAAAALLPIPEEVPEGTYVAGVPVGGLDRAEVRTALAGPVAARVGGPVRLLMGDEVAQVDPAAAGITLNRTATEQALFDGAPESVLDRFRDRRSVGRHDVPVALAVKQSVLDKTIKSRLSTFNQAAKDATVTLPAPAAVLTEKGDAEFSAAEAEATVVPAAVGRRVDASAAATALRNAVAAQRPEVRLAVVQTEPKLSTAQASEVDQLIGTFTTQHACCAPRVTNIHRIAEIVDGTVIRPGATFSLNAASGPRTAENGFVSAPAIADGELVDQFGGGVSQFSTTLFNAAWFSGLPILRHQPHSKYISRYPPGREATLDFDTIDQTIRNDTDAPVVIRAATTGTSVTVALYGHTGDRKVESTTGERVPRTGGGFRITVQRVVLDSGSVHRRDTLNWSYTGLD
jgi:vancomycin resistance protein YoaR